MKKIMFILVALFYVNFASAMHLLTINSIQDSPEHFFNQRSSLPQVEITKHELIDYLPENAINVMVGSGCSNLNFDNNTCFYTEWVLDCIVYTIYNFSSNKGAILHIPAAYFTPSLEGQISQYFAPFYSDIKNVEINIVTSCTNNLQSSIEFLQKYGFIDCLKTIEYEDMEFRRVHKRVCDLIYSSDSLNIYNNNDDLIILDKTRNLNIYPDGKTVIFFPYEGKIKVFNSKAN